LNQVGLLPLLPVALPLRPASVNRALALLKHLYSKAIEWGKVKETPAKKVVGAPAVTRTRGAGIRNGKKARNIEHGKKN
jgi:hypothetical protein